MGFKSSYSLVVIGAGSAFSARNVGDCGSLGFCIFVFFVIIFVVCVVSAELCTFGGISSAVSPNCFFGLCFGPNLADSHM